MNQFNRAYFIGVGGIGMSALARYFNFQGWKVGGYDKTKTPLTANLEEEGIDIHYEDFGPSLPELFKNVENTLIIYTPAIPENFGELLHVQYSGYAVIKRAEVLGMITRDSKALGVAGTHGKTTTSTMLAHMLNESELKCNAFLGGISTNFNSNFVSGDSDLTVVEADEFDRSFLQLNPFASIVTSTDADHLDIYGNNDDFLIGFKEYAKRINPAGFLIRHVDVALNHPNEITYALNQEAEFSGSNPRFENGQFLIDLATPKGTWKDIELGLPGLHNAENAIACIALCLELELTQEVIRQGLKSFKGVKRRFEYHVREDDFVYIDDYAHHPTEIKALVSSVRLLYPNQRITGVFQPHLFTRTRDFFDEFAYELSQLDEVILLPIYPAREEPIAGITSEALLSKITTEDKKLMSPTQAVEYLTSSDRIIERSKDRPVLLTIGAGDIDRIVPQLITEFAL
ncbi:MAG: UDP-N-acetylmuramate--L-alanine ligase [Crocinitomicaceae bacterium]|nr:UDP-N-acetylmuramate--L-alanine ligase [Crocinitomicaceae bacterium]